MLNISIYQTILCIILSIFIVNAYLQNKISNNKGFSFKLEASKHHARYGQFLDRLEPKKDTKMNEVLSKLDIKSFDKFANDLVTGDQLRSSRQRNLVIAQKELPTEDLSGPARTSKWTNDDITSMIGCLNKCLANQVSKGLTDETRLGLIDWIEFDNVASNIIINYDSERTKTNIKNWIKYHRQRKEIVIDKLEWKWIPKVKGKNRKY